MIGANPNSMCAQAHLYYYEYLCGEPRESIPAEILTHIGKCRFCQDEVNRLEIVLADSEECATEGTTNTTSAIITNLRLHFAYTGAFVSCNTIKPFLPSLAIPALEVGVPTPITVHLDKCRQCANDLEAIQQLNLTYKQLCRLGQLFAEESAPDNVCANARGAIDSVEAMVFEDTSAETLRHLCVCPDCRKLLYKNREARNETLSKKLEQSPIHCDAVSAADIFDYVVPYGIDPGSARYVMFRQSLKSHLISCPECLDKMQKLHSAVYGILERQQSGVVTCFKVGDRAQDYIMGSADDMYEDWPIKVEVFDESKPAPVASTALAGFPQILKKRAKKLALRPFTKLAAVAAAVILAAFLLLNVPAAKAVNLGQIAKVLERVKNVCITTFVPQKPEPTQEIWISQALNIKMLQTKTQRVLWDIKDRSKKSRDSNTGLIKTVGLDDEVLAKVEETMKAPWALLPFDDISAVPEDAKWQKVTDGDIETTVSNTEVYDLVWVEKGLNGSIVYKKWRGYINTGTKLPSRIEWWERRTEEQEYRLLTVTKVAYPAIDEIRAVIRGAGF